MSYNALFSPLRLGALSLPNRFIMAPLTRCRAEADHIPGDLMREYYAQRAGAGLIVAEATMVSPGNSAFWTEPGIYSQEQIEGWRKVTDAVHAKGGLIALQIWHGGRACHPLMNNGAIPVGPSAIAITNNEIQTPEGKKPYVTPRELRDDELPAIVAAFAQGARNAASAGFDAIEVHSANGYLLDEFLRDGANKRTGPYGGSIENRARLLFEVLEAVTSAVGAERTGVRLSPLNGFNSMSDSDPLALAQFLGERLNDFNLAFLHVMRSNFVAPTDIDVMTPIRAAYKGALIGNMGYDAAEAEATIAAGKLDAVAFGAGFIANPDLPARIRDGAPLNAPDPTTFYSRGPVGYTDYPTLGE